MDPVLAELMRAFAKTGYGVVEALAVADAAEWLPGGRHQATESALFARLVVLLAMHDNEMPLGAKGHAVDLAFCEGDGDLGLDGVAIAIGERAVHSPEEARALLAEFPDALVRVLLVQAKRRGESAAKRDMVSGEDIAKFVFDCHGWLTNDEAKTKARMGRQNNPAAWRQWHIWQAIREVHAEASAAGNAGPFRPDVMQVFAYGGHWSEHDTPVQYSAKGRGWIESSLPGARVETDIWGAQDLASAADYARVGLKRTLNGYDYCEVPAVPIPMDWCLPDHADVTGPSGSGDAMISPPTGTARSCIGYMRVTDLLEAFFRRRRRRGAVTTELDHRFFLDNPRSFLKLDRTEQRRGDDDWNRGARSIDKAVRRGHANVLGLGHNGVVIVCREARPTQARSLMLTGPQVVNGCQSCFTLAGLHDQLEQAFIPVKVIVTDNTDLTDFVIRAANTQAPLDEWDLVLGRSEEVLALQRAFMRGLSLAADRVWLKRGWNDHISETADFSRAVHARDLLEASAAAFLAKPHGDPKALLELIGEGLFDPEHEPNAYRAVAWMLVAFGQWMVSAGAEDAGRRKGYRGARFQVVHALWNLLDEKPERPDLRRGRPARERAQRLIDRLIADAASGHAMVERAVGCVEATWREMPHGRGLAAAAREAAFTKRVSELAAAARKSADATVT